MAWTGVVQQVGGAVTVAAWAARVVAIGLALAAPAAATTFTVNTTSDTTDGTCDATHCSLREALLLAQAGGPHTIAFDIPGPGVKTITAATCLPGIFRNVTIDGYTQPGSSPNTNPTGAINAVPLIEIEGTPACATGFSAVFADALLTIKGLVINSFNGPAVIGTLTTVRLEGSFIGTTPDGMAAAVPAPWSGSGVVIDTGTAIVGGVTPATRNLIAGVGRALHAGGSPKASQTITAQGNLIGTNKLGTAVIGVDYGYASGGCNGGNATLQLGGSTPEARNVIAGASLGAIHLFSGGAGCGEYTSANTFIKGNYIGTDVSGTGALGNGGPAGILAQGGPNVSIGGVLPGEGNIIAHSAGAGVIALQNNVAQRIRILGNRIYGNGGMGIDLQGNAGVTVNDPDDADAFLQNFPVITSVTSGGGTVTVAGTLDSAASTTYRLEFFRNDAADSSSHGEGQVFLGAADVTTSGSGTAAFSVALPGAVSSTQFVTATATDPDGNTSEFSKLEADVSLTNTDAPDPASVNQDVTHTLVVSNSAASVFPSGNLTLTYTRAAGSTLISDGGGTASGSTVTFNLGILPIGQSVSRTVVVRYATVGAKASSATVASVVSDPVPADNTAAATTTVQLAPAVTYTISGQVRDLNDTGVPGVTMTLSGTMSATLSTDLEGHYAFTGLTAGGTYTVTPSKQTFVFVPPSQTFANLQQNQVAGFFVAEVGSFTRYFAEGATSSFFDTQIALLNATGKQATALVRFQKSDGTEVVQQVSLGGLDRRTVDPKALGLASAEFSTVIESDQPIIADRTMAWDTSHYGAHAETSIGRPLTRWFLAEGATINGFELFYLVQNPNPTAAQVEVRYLLPSGVPLVRQYSVPAASRFNIWVNLEDPLLADAEVSADITSDIPVIVERAMYRAVNGQPFAAGHESAGVEEPTLAWYFAEGATGPFFDLFFLVANPNPQPATVEATYLKPDGTVIARTYTAPANSRSNVWVDQEGVELANTAVATTFTVTNGVPVVIERAMWWAGDAANWHEGHNTAGATATGEKFGLAEGEVGGPFGLQTYILVANTSAQAGTVRVTLTFEDNSPQVTRDFPITARSRLNVAVGAEFPEAAGRRFGAIVESVGTAPVQIIVERAMYNDAGGVTWAGGTSALATRLR